MDNFTQKPDNSTLRVLLTIASIIQKESNSAKEMPLISSVIFNRLDKGMRLQMDGTLNYGKNSRTIVTPERIKTDTSYYNTYKYKGLPPAPISSVTLDALHAAMHPAKSDYLFFMLKPDGSHTFASSYEKHLKRIPELAGKITVRFTIAASGRVTSVQILENTTGNNDLERDISRKIKMWRFEKIAEGDVTVTYPFVFQPA